MVIDASGRTRGGRRSPGSDEAGPPILDGPEPTTPSRPPRFESFDGLRAIAALMVVGLHTSVISGWTYLHAHGLGRYTSHLGSRIAVFFLISGFLLYRPFTVAHLGRAPAPGARSFWVRRLLRIVPAYWVALFFATTVFHHAGSIGPGGWKAYATHYLLLQIYFPSQDSGGPVGGVDLVR